MSTKKKKETTKPALRLEWLEPDQLDEHPQNWKTHPGEQLCALEAAVGKVGWAGALLLNERTGRLLDGHARKKLDPGLLVDGRLPVLIGDWSEEDERVILATLDPIGSMAEAETGQLQDLLEGVDVEGALKDLLDSLTPSLPAVDEVLGDDGDEDLDAADVKITVGPYTFELAREAYDAWIENIWQEHGFDKDSVVAELRRRLDL